MMPATGFSDFAARAAGLIDDCGRPQSGEPLQASWDGLRLSLVLPTDLAWAGKPRPDSGPGPTLDFGQGLAVWDPRGRLAGASRLFLGGSSMGKVMAGEVHALLAGAYAAGRRAEGLHGNGVFAQHFRRLETDPDFPAVVVGFGPGTTPAGDDWLAGCLVALDLCAGGPGKAAADLRQKIHDRLMQTTSAGRALLLGALAGAPPEYLVGLAEASAEWMVAVAGNPEIEERQPAELVPRHGRLRDAVLSCLGHGATSGEDALAGFVYGFGADM